MASPFTPPPAGTPVPPNTSARYYTRTQVFSRVPVNKDNFTSGKQASFILESTGGRHIDFANSRIVCKMSVKSGSTTADATVAAANYAAADKKLEKSVRFATDPVTNLFSAGMLSINGTTISSHASNVADVSYLQLRTEHTKAGADGPGSAGLLSFNQKMTHEERGDANLDFTGGGSDPTKNDSTPAETVAGLPAVYKTTDERSDKHEILLRNASGSTIAAHANTKAIEISTPLGNIFPFCRTEFMLPNIQARMDLTISDSHRAEMFFTEILQGEASSAALRANNAAATAFGVPHGGEQLAANVLVPGYVSPVAPASFAPLLEIEEIYVDLMMAVPAQILPPPTSYQIPFQEVSVYTRSLANGDNYTENFTSIPSSVGMVVLGLRSSAKTVGTNRELYSLGNRIRTATFSLGNLQLPQPGYQMQIENLQMGRLFADWLSVTGGSASNGVGGEGSSLTSFADSPLIAIRCLQDPGSYASTATWRFTIDPANPIVDADNAELVMWVVHQRVAEFFYQSGETFPNRVIVDDVLN